MKPTSDRNVGALLKSFDDAYDTTVTGAFKQSEDAFEGFDKMFSANTPQALRKRMLAEQAKSKHEQLKEAGATKPKAKPATKTAAKAAYASGSKAHQAAVKKKAAAAAAKAHRCTGTGFTAPTR